MRRTVVGVLAGAALAVPALALLGAVAHADDSGIQFNVGDGWVHSPDAPLLHVDRLAPGRGASADVDVRNGSGGPASLSVAAVNIADDDNGCVHPELAAGDATCGSGEGDLAPVMTFVISQVDADRVTTLWSGTIGDLAQGVGVGEDFAAGQVRTLRLATELPWSASNTTQTDQLSYDLRWTLSSDVAATSTTVEGERIDRPSGHSTTMLPFTGVELSRDGLLGITALFSGIALVLAARLRRGVPA